jgi:hypothetical protein
LTSGDTVRFSRRILINRVRKYGVISYVILRGRVEICKPISFSRRTLLHGVSKVWQAVPLSTADSHDPQRLKTEDESDRQKYRNEE